MVRAAKITIRFGMVSPFFDEQLDHWNDEVFDGLKRIRSAQLLCLTHGDSYNLGMPVFDEKQEELEHYETMMGIPRGRLAVTMDMITDAMALVGQHGVYCQSQRWPGKPVMDIQIVMKSLTGAKELIQSVMEELKKATNNVPKDGRKE
jgi:hypothetical protein